MRKSSIFFIIVIISLIGYKDIFAATMEEVATIIENRVNESSTVFENRTDYFLFRTNVNGKTYETEFDRDYEHNRLFYELKSGLDSIDLAMVSNDRDWIMIVLEAIAKANGKDDFSPSSIPYNGNIEDNGIKFDYYSKIDEETEHVTEYLVGMTVDLDRFPVSSIEDPDPEKEPDETEKPTNPEDEISKELSELIDEFKKTEFYKVIGENNQFYEDIKIDVDKEKFSITLTENGHSTTSNFTFKNNILSYNIDASDYNDLNTFIKQVLADDMLIYTFIKMAITKNGYDVLVDNIDFLNYSFQNEGIELISAIYSGNNTDYLKSFKLDFENFKIKSSDLTQNNPETPNKPKLPSLKLVNSNSYSVTLEVTYDKSGLCDIYRSINDGSFALIKTISCDGIYTDLGLNPNTIYKYKVGINGLMSEPLSAKTGSPSTTVKNPQTGRTSIGLAIIIMTSLCIYAIVKLKRRTVFKQL